MKMMTYFVLAALMVGGSASAQTPSDRVMSLVEARSHCYDRVMVPFEDLLVCVPATNASLMEEPSATRPASMTSSALDRYFSFAVGITPPLINQNTTSILIAPRTAPVANGRPEPSPAMFISATKDRTAVQTVSRFIAAVEKGQTGNLPFDRSVIPDPIGSWFKQLEVGVLGLRKTAWTETLAGVTTVREVLWAD